jgi:hypothetical protein
MPSLVMRVPTPDAEPIVYEVQAILSTQLLHHEVRQRMLEGLDVGVPGEQMSTRAGTPQWANSSSETTGCSRRAP